MPRAGCLQVWVHHRARQHEVAALRRNVVAIADDLRGLTLRHVSAEIAKRDFVNQRGPSSRIASMRSAPDAQGKSIGIAGDIFWKPPQQNELHR
jgi:hypothetical protein